MMRVLEEYGEDLMLESIEFALDRSRDDRARAPMLAKMVELHMRATGIIKRGPLIAVSQDNSKKAVIVSHLGIPQREVGPGSEQGPAVPPLRQLAPPKAVESVVPGELISSHRAPATPKAMYGPIPESAADAEVLEAEAWSGDRGPELPTRLDPAEGSRKVRW